MAIRGYPRHVAAGLLLVSLGGCGTVDCSTDVINVARDPGSDLYAVTESRNCGATTGYATVIRVGRRTEPQSDATEVFVADSDHGAARAGPGGTVWTAVFWEAPGRLSVSYASHARIFKQAATAKAAHIEYGAKDPIEPMPPA